MQIRNSLFFGIDEQRISYLLEDLRARWEEYEKGQTILQEGSSIQEIGIVEEGRVMISHFDVWGRASLLGQIGPGDVFGEAYACAPDQALQVHVMAMEKTRVQFLHIQQFLRIYDPSRHEHSLFLQNLLQIGAKRTLQLSRRMRYMEQKTIRGKLMLYFSDCAQEQGSKTLVLPYNRQQLADYLHVDRSAMCHALSLMQEEGRIRYHRNEITLLMDEIDI